MTSKSSNTAVPVSPQITAVIWLWGSLLFCFVACSYVVWFHFWNIARLIEYQKCPVCYGESLCPVLHQKPDLLKVQYWGYFGWVANSFTTKNVYRGSLNSVEVIIKRLGHDSELTEMDEKICSKIPHFCKNEAELSDNLYDPVSKELRNLVSNRLAFEQDINRMRFCPTLENLVKVFKIIYGSTRDDRLPVTQLINTWTILHINAEPFVLQLFPKEQGWPFPQYLGACGRIIIETFEGHPLLDFYDESWDKRARLSLQLLNAVDKFTFHHPDFALYLLDYSPDNIAVNAGDSVSFVDLEHVIIVDKRSSFFDEKENLLHLSSTFCTEADCSYYSPDDICEHQTSDFNHFMLCKEILAPSKDPFVAMPQGLLHSAPFDEPLLESALKNCSSDANVNHMIPAQILRDLLQKIVAERDGKFAQRAT